MYCAWKEFLALLPTKWKQQADALGRETAMELRLRLQRAPVLVRTCGTIRLEGCVQTEDLHYVVNMACRYSPWTAGTAQWGYLTGSGGHRIGLCGDAITTDGRMAGFREVESVNIRIARDFPGIAGSISNLPGSILIVGSPGSGKTTLLRDLIRQLSYRENISVVDERCELFPSGFDRGDMLDVLLGCSKPEGIDRVLRAMTPDTIAIDEITASTDTAALVQAAWCGVRLLATAHASNLEDLRSREIYQPVVHSKLFSHAVILRKDKSFRVVERMEV